ncbi:DUF6708 domain-containing protein [Pseudomonas sp. PSKL.D1]|uniref:DUF6708 domain-containing protein n=1 Tax=Pseudomonas sp. PSKL.D1 TaxID=3029060 RepID=UPI0023811284|nr:DUF6708 domain-containing protein [Pseudomonas sp. PSKL.D1]WDY56041.1 hypothetical protein PVV54_15680 [Pseudomonas sp. PSKL.D1]
MKIKRLPKRLRFAGTKLHHGLHQRIAPQPDGVRRVNETCVELETYANLVQSASAGFIGVSVLASLITAIIIAALVGTDAKTLMGIFIWSPALPCFAVLFYFASGAHRCRGAFIRINRNTRKLYFINPKKPERMHVMDWDHVEGIAGFIPIVTSHGYTSRHPLYLLSVDHAMAPPTEICIACGNLGVIDGDRSARMLWTYLQWFMAKGLEGLPEPPPLKTKPSRREASIQPYREWVTGLRKELGKPYGWLWSPISVPVWLFLLFFNAYPDSVEAWIQYNVPYAAFPRENDVLCGFAENRRSVTCGKGVKLEQ